MDYTSAGIALLEGRGSAELCGVLGASQGQQPCRKQHWFNWELGCVLEAGRSRGQGAYMFVGGSREESCSAPMGLGCRVCRGFLWCQGEHLAAFSTPCSLGASSPAAGAQTSSSGLGFWEESAPDSQWDFGVGVCQGQAVWGHLFPVGLQS